MFVTNLFSHKFLDHWSATFTLIIKIHQISGFYQAMKAKTSDLYHLFYTFSILCSKLTGAFAQDPSLIDQLQVTSLDVFTIKFLMDR